MSLLSTCAKHNEIVVNYLFNIDCPLCQALETIQTMEGEIERLKRDVYLLEEELGDLESRLEGTV